MLRSFAAVVLSVFLIFLIVEIHEFSERGKIAETQYSQLSAELDKAKIDYSNLQSDFEYYSNPANLEKELRARFNYKSPGEKLIILIPATSSAATSSP